MGPSRSDIAAGAPHIGPRTSLDVPKHCWGYHDSHTTSRWFAVSDGGYDQRSKLYLMSSLKLPPIPERPSKEQALEALEHLTELFCEFSFSDKEGKKRLNQSVALSGLLTAS